MLSATGWLAGMTNLDGIAAQASGWGWWPGIGITLPSRRKATSSLCLVTCGFIKSAALEVKTAPDKPFVAVEIVAVTK